MTQPERIADTLCSTGEGPLWHPDEERFYWVDIPNGRLYRWDPETGDHEICYETSAIGGATLQTNGSLLLFEDRGRIEIWRDGATETIVEEIPDERDSRFNDVIADPQGRVYCGTMGTDDHSGRLYRLDTDGSLTRLFGGVDVPNGMGFTADRNQFYFTDSPGKTIYQFAYDESTGDISDREVFLDLTDEQGVPDGMTVDSDGFVWSARWDGSCLVRYAPDGTEDRRIEFPAMKVSSVTFGGADYDELFVTTALGAGGEGDPATREAQGEGAGAVFRLDPGVRGRAEFRSRVGLEDH